MKEENFNKHITTTHKELFSPLLFRSQRSNGTASNGHHHHNGTANGHSNGHINGGSSSSRRPLSAVNNGTSSSSSRSSSSAAARAAKMANGHSNTLSVNGIVTLTMLKEDRVTLNGSEIFHTGSLSGSGGDESKLH